VKHRKLPVLARLAGYRAEHATMRTRQLPINLTVSVTYSCPSRCATCDIWQKKVDDLSVDEYGKMFRTLERVPIWVTLSGGDQFVRRDLDEIVRLVREEIEPTIINIPMNGVITERIHQLLPRIAAFSRGSQLVLNLSVDEIGEAHDRIRGADRNWEKLLEVASLIRDLKKTYDHIVMGVHTVISKLNVHRIPEIEREARAVFSPDSYITEVAEMRVELKTMEKDITPSSADYRRAVAHLKNVIKSRRSPHPVARLVESFRLVPTPRAPTASLSTAPVREIYRSRSHANLWVIDKENGGKADALNAGLNLSASPLFCAMDADSLFERRALARIVRPFLEDARTVAAGGTIRIANGCDVESGIVRRIGLPDSLLARFQVLEYLRAFLSGRMGWDALDATLIISGAFGLFRRSTVVGVGGYATSRTSGETVGEDMELVVRLHRRLREAGTPYRIAFVPDPVAWTECPETLAVLGRQRDRWQRGLLESLKADETTFGFEMPTEER